jgi:hypothetical protein
MKEKFQKFYLSYVCVVLSTRGFAHSPELCNIGEIMGGSWELLWEWHLTSRRLCGTCVMDGRNRISFKYPKEVQSNLWWLHAIPSESLNSLCTLSDVTQLAMSAQ